MLENKGGKGSAEVSLPSVSVSIHQRNGLGKPLNAWRAPARGLVGRKGIGKGTRAAWESSFFQTNGCAAAEAVICEEVMHNVNHLRT